MAWVTIELRNVLEMEDFTLFDFPYKCDNPEWKETLEKAIIDRYYFEEIGQETIDRWKHIFRAKMQRIMPYYNELYNTTLLGGDPFLTYKGNETFAGDSKTFGNQGQIMIDTDHPQTQNPAQDIPTRKQDLNTDNEQDTVNNYVKTVEGFTGIPYSDLLKKHRETILRITTMVLDELKPCFILVY